MQTRPGRTSCRDPRRLRVPVFFALVAAVLAGVLLPGCRLLRASRPNVLWIVWDTVRADRVGIYGSPWPTTPFLDRWAKGARVFTDCSSVASTTAPAHASMFTGLLPYQHGSSNVHPLLPSELKTLPEIFRDHGYQTCMYSENPYISRETGFGQGFDAVFHPWDEALRARAAEVIEGKVPPGSRTARFSEQLRERNVSERALSACGTLGEPVLADWLTRRDRSRPFFVFMNYMEAHAPVITPESYRRRFLSPEEVRRSYEIGLSPLDHWLYTLGLEDRSPQDLEILEKTYAASLGELDDLFGSLIGRLEKLGVLGNTIVVVTSDHGEHLGGHHLLDHEYSLYQPVLKVPLILWYPRKVTPGRETRPTMNTDLFRTLQELAGFKAAPGNERAVVSLLHPLGHRTRPASFPDYPTAPFDLVRRARPEFDPAPFERTLRSVERDDTKLIWASDGTLQLYDLASDSGESRNLAPERPALARALLDSLRGFLSAPVASLADRGTEARLSQQQKELLRSLGYIGAE